MPVFQRRTITSVLIAGGTGFLGSALRPMLEEQGYRVKFVTRRRRRWEADRVTWEEIQKEGLKDCDAVVNFTGENVLNPYKRWSASFRAECYNSRVKNTSFLAGQICRATRKPKVFVSMSGVGIYKPDEEKVYDERTDVGPSFDFISNLAHNWEKAADVFGSTRSIILRSGVVLGKQGGMIGQIYLPFLLGLGGPLGDGRQYFPWIHVDDLCRLVLFSIDNENVNGVLNAVAPQIVTNKEFTEALGKSMRRSTSMRMPEKVINLIFGPERAVMMLKGQKVVPRRAQNYEFKYLYPDIEKACEALVREPVV